MSFFDRLREERKGLKLTQKQLAAKLDITEQAQVSYEKGKLPKFVQYLEGLVQIGADVPYIITGERGGVQLSEEDAEFLALLRKATPAVRETAMMVLRTGTVISKQVNVGRDNFGNIRM